MRLGLPLIAQTNDRFDEDYFAKILLLTHTYINDATTNNTNIWHALLRYQFL